MTAPTILVLAFDERGPIPNNVRFPALIYQRAFPDDLADLAAAMEQRFAENGWPPAWRNGIYAVPHAPANGHEALGIAKGAARLVLGGEGGRELEVSAGDVLLLPAGIFFAGFFLLTLQGVSELIKRVAALRGLTDINTNYEKPLQ